MFFNKKNKKNGNNNNHIYFLLLDEKKYNLNFSQSFIVKHSDLMKDILNIYQQDENAIIYLINSSLGISQIVFNTYNLHLQIVYLYGMQVNTNYCHLKDNYVAFQQIDSKYQVNEKDYLTHNLKITKNNIVLILDLQNQTLIYCIGDEYNNLVGHALDYFKSIVQDQGERIKILESKIYKYEQSKQIV